MNIVGLSISQWLPCPLAIWAFGLDGKSCMTVSLVTQRDINDIHICMTVSLVIQRDILANMNRLKLLQHQEEVLNDS